MPAPQEKQPDQKRIVAAVAEESHVPVDDVATLYDHERADLAVRARITKFLHVFAIRNVQAILLKRSLDKLALTLRAAPLLAV